MASNKPFPVDSRIISPLVSSPEDGLARWPCDTLFRIRITLNLLADLLSGYSDEENLLASSDTRFALFLQLNGLADLLGAVSDVVIVEQKGSLRPGEVPVLLNREAMRKLEILAGRQGGMSVAEMAATLILEQLKSVHWKEAAP